MNETKEIAITQQEARLILWALGYLQEWVLDSSAPDERKEKTLEVFDSISAKIDIAFIIGK